MIHNMYAPIVSCIATCDKFTCFFHVSERNKSSLVLYEHIGRKFGAGSTFHLN